MAEPSSSDISSGKQSSRERYVLIEPDPFCAAANEYAESGLPWDERARRVDTLQLSGTREQVWNPETGEWELANNYQAYSYDKAVSRRVPGSGNGDRLVWVRPYNGLVPKEGTQAYMVIMDDEGNMIPLKTGSPGQETTNYYTDFSVISVNQHRREIRQILTTFGAPFVFFFGESPRLVEFQGTLIDSENYNWNESFLENYDTKLRGTRLAEMKARLYVGWNDFLVHGYGLSLRVVERSSNPSQVMFDFAMLIVGEVRIGSGLDAPTVRDFQSALDSQLRLLAENDGSLSGSDDLLSLRGALDGTPDSLSGSYGAVGFSQSNINKQLFGTAHSNGRVPSLSDEDLYNECSLRYDGDEETAQSVFEEMTRW